MISKNFECRVFIAERGNIYEESIYDNFESAAKDLISKLSNSHEEYFLMKTSLLKKLKRESGNSNS